jgi:hypothetical protein
MLLSYNTPVHNLISYSLKAKHTYSVTNDLRTGSTRVHLVVSITVRRKMYQQWRVCCLPATVATIVNYFLVYLTTLCELQILHTVAGVSEMILNGSVDETWETHEKSHSGEQVIRSRFELVTSRIGVKDTER